MKTGQAAAHSTAKSGQGQETRASGHKQKSNDSAERSLALSRRGLGVCEPDNRCAPDQRLCPPQLQVLVPTRPQVAHDSCN